MLSVLYCLTCSYTPWKRMILPIDQMLSTIWHIALFIGCLYAWSRKSCQSLLCYTASHVFIHLQNEWSYPLIEFYRPYGILHVFIGCLYEWSRESCQPLMWCVKLPHMSLYTSKTNDRTHWSNFIDRMAYHMYILDACMNDLVSLVNP